MGDNEIFHIAVMPPVETSIELLSRVAAIVFQPNYQIRLQLAGRIPKIIGHFCDPFSAETAVHSLKELGLVAFGITESELRRPVPPESITRSIQFIDDKATFTSQNGQDAVLNRSDVFLIMSGRRTTVIAEAAFEKSTMKVNVPATLLTGGIPIMKRVTSKTQESQKTTQQFIRLYRKESDFPAIDLRQFGLDYSFLGDKMNPTATSNIVQTAAELKRFFSTAYFNDSLLNGFVADTNTITGINLGEQSCLLLVRYYQTLAREAA